MVKHSLSQMQFRNKTIKILLIVAIVYYINFKNNVIFAEGPEMSHEEAIINLQKLVHERLLRFINQEDFKAYYVHKFYWFYNNYTINEQDVRNFIKTISWPDVIEKIKLKHETVLSDITKEFAEYCEEITNERFTNYLQKKAQAYTNAINYCNNLVKESGSFILNNLPLAGWFFAGLLVYKMYYDPSNLNLIYQTLDHSAVDSSKPYLQRVLELIPQFKPHIHQDNSAIEINNIAGYILTPNAKAELQSTVQTAVADANTTLIIIGSIICIGIFIGSLTYF